MDQDVSRQRRLTRKPSLLTTQTHELLAKEFLDRASRSARDAVESPSPGGSLAVPPEVQPVSKKRKASQIYHSPRRAKKDWTYDLAEVMELFQVGRSTVYNWRMKGLKHVPVWPILFRGQDLNDFHRDRRQKARRSFALGQFLCFFCKRVQSLVGHSAVFTGAIRKWERFGGFVPIAATIMRPINLALGTRFWKAPESNSLTSKQTSPHSVRSTLMRLGLDMCATWEELKAWSQNLGHERLEKRGLKNG